MNLALPQSVVCHPLSPLLLPPHPHRLPLSPSWTLHVGCQYNYMGLVLMTIVLDSHDAAIILKYKWFMVTISDMPLSTLIRQNTNLNKNSRCIVRYWNKDFFLAKQCIICTEDKSFWTCALFQLRVNLLVRNEAFFKQHRERKNTCEINSRLKFVSCFGRKKNRVKGIIWM